MSPKTHFLIQVSKPVVKDFQYQYHCLYQEDNVRYTQDNQRRYNVEVKDLATHPPDMPPAEQVLYILGQHDMVWCGILAGSCCGASRGKDADFSAPNSAYYWSDSDVTELLTGFNIQIQVTPKSCDLIWHLESSKFEDFSYRVEVLRYKHALSWECQSRLITEQNFATVRGLCVGQRYCFSITPIKKDGTEGHGYRSRTVSPMDLTPSVKRYTENDSNRYFHLTWNPPGEAHLIHGYHVEQTLVGSSLGWMRLNDNILQSREYVVTDLEPGQCYKYRIVVVTDEAEYRGGKTDPKKAMHVPQRPGQPAVYNVTNRSCCLEWMAPNFEGGSPVIRYEIEMQAAGMRAARMRAAGMRWTECKSVSGDKMSTKVDDLTEKGSYRFRVRAVNHAGTGEYSLESEDVKATGISLSDSSSLAQLEPYTLEKKGMESVSKSFELGVSYFIKLMESLSKLTSSVTHREADMINKDVWIYSERLFNHMRDALSKTETVTSEINKRIENIMCEISKKEQEQRDNEIESATLDEQIRNLQSELEDLEEEKEEAEEKYEAIKRDLREAEKKLKEAKGTQYIVKAVGTAGLFVPYVGWFVSAVTLPVAFTVLQDNVDAAKNSVDSEYDYMRSKERQVDSKSSEIRANKHGSKTLQNNKKQLQTEIRQFKELRKSLKQNLNQHAETSVQMRKCVNFVGGAQCRAEFLHDQIKHFYDLAMVIEPLLDMASHLSNKQAETLRLLPSNFNIGIAAGKLQMITAAAECQTSFNTPAYLKDFKEVPTLAEGSDGSRALMEIHSLTQDISSCSRDDERMILSEYVNCSGFLGSAPATNALIGQLLLISLKHDFAIDEKQPVGGFKYLKQPKSFRVSMFQTANAASDAFFLAHKNMDQIRLYSKTSPSHLTSALKMLEHGSPLEISRLLSKPLSLIKDTSEKCLQLSKDVQQKFLDAVDIMDELQEACVSTKSQTDKKQQENKAMLMEAEQEKETLETKKLQREDELRRKQQSLQHEQETFEKAKSKDTTKGIIEGVAYAAFSKLFGPSSEKTPKKSKSHEKFNKAGSTKPRLFEDIDVNLADSLLEDAITLENNTTQLHAALCNIKKDNVLLDVRTCQAKYKRINRREIYVSEEHSQIRHALSLSQIGMSLCQDIIPLCESMNSNENVHLEIKESVENFHNECEAFVEDSKSLKADAETKWKEDIQRKQYKDTDNIGTGYNYDLEQVRYKSGITFNRMMKADAEYDRASKKARRARQELANIVSEIAGMNMETLDLKQIVDILCRCLKQLGNLKEEWGKMVSLFQKITSIIDTTLNRSLKEFIDVSKTTRFYKPETFRLSGTKRQILYEEVMKASEVAFFIQHFTESYTEVSERFFMPVLEALPRLLKTSDRGNSSMEEQLKQLQTDSVAAQTRINDHLDRKQHHFQSALKTRLAAIEECLNRRIPELENTCTATTIQGGTISLDPDDFA